MIVDISMEVEASSSSVKIFLYVVDDHFTGKVILHYDSFEK